MSDYDTDLAAWASEQAEALRARRHNALDWDHLAEEIEDVRKRFEQQIGNRLTTACVHLLELRFQPEMTSNSWRSAVVRSRVKIARLTKTMPSLKEYPAQALAEAYEDAWPIAAAETGLTGLPRACPWTIDEVLGMEFWPYGRYEIRS